MPDQEEHPNDQLIGEITAAFDGVSRENGISLHEAEAIDSHGSPEELLTTRRIDLETRWQDVPADWLAEFSSAYRFMDAKGLRYYSPAVMIWELSGRKDETSSSDDNLFSLLTSERFSSRTLNELFSILTVPQRGVVAKWLLHFATNCYGESPERTGAKLRSTPWEEYLP